MTWRTRCIAAFCAVFLIAQVAIPTAALVSPRPARFGWQMFSGVKPAPRVWIVDGTGAVREVDPLTRLGNPRGDLEYLPALAVGLCEMEPDAVAIRYDVRDGRDEATAPCR